MYMYGNRAGRYPINVKEEKKMEAYLQTGFIIPLLRKPQYILGIAEFDESD